MKRTLSWRALTALAVAGAVSMVPAAARADGGDGGGRGDHHHFGHGGRIEDDHALPEHDHGDDHGRGDHGVATLSDPIAQGLAGPLQIAVQGRSVYVAQSFASVLTKIDRNSTTDIATNPGGEIAGVDVRGNTVYYTSSNFDPATETATATAVNVLRHGQSSVLLDTLTFETNNNPDQGTTYGFESIPADCTAQWPVDMLGPTQYTGIVDSHPYAVAAWGKTVFVADAAGNDIIAVDRHGNPRVVAVLPPQPLVITADAAAALGLPECVVGLTYHFEPVPTDVEVGHDGMLYVTTLPGGPEDPSLGARGSVYRIDPWSGATERVATGFLGATNLALGPHDQIYVSELFGNQVSRVVDGAPQPVLELASPAGLEYAHGRLYVSYDVFANGTVATIRFGHGHEGHGGEDD